VELAGARSRAFPRVLGVLGTGLRASAVAKRLLDVLPRGASLAIFGRDLDRVAELEYAGARRAASPADLAARSEVVFIVLRGLDEFEAMLSGPSGLQAGVHSPTTAVISTPIPPELGRDLARRLPDSSTGLLRVVDAPLTGRLESIASGTLSIMVGASPAAYLDLMPVLELLGQPIRVGGVGSGLLATACAQLVIAATAMALGEAAVLIERCGLALDEVLAGWQGSDVESEVLRASAAHLIAKSYETSMPADEMLGWLKIADREALRTSTRTDLVRGMLDLYEELSDSDLADADLSVTQALVEHRTARTLWEQGARGPESETREDDEEVDPPVDAEPGRQTGARHVAAPAARMLGSA
jgi:3-hydroxyisobutyrate dehydrogenase-like beta-hydroxyacid dehydrogenase